MIYFLLLFVGITLILLGANFLTDGASAVAKRFNISEIVIGLTIVAFGTSAPELTVSMMSALNGMDDISIGNIVGSNIFNTLMIVGCTAMVSPIAISKNTLKNEIPLSILASIVLVLCVKDQWLNNMTLDVISRGEGGILLLFFCIFLSYTFSIAHNPSGEVESVTIKSMPVWKSAFYVILGLVALIGGGKLFVNGAVGIAHNFGVSEAVIGLTIVAGGTSLPELATSVVAALKKCPGIAIGNVIGSNLFNIFLVLGCSASITPLKMSSGITNVDIFIFLISSVLLLIFGLLFGKRIINRIEGMILFLIYIIYIVYLVMQ